MHYKQGIENLTEMIINGQPSQQIDARDRALHYGDGLFETIAVKAGKLQALDEHLQRLHEGCQRLSLVCPDKSVWMQDIEKLSIENDAVIKLILSRGVSGRGYAYDESSEATRIVAAYDWPDYPEQNQQGIKVRICQTPVSINTALAGLKHLNRLDNVLARNEWRNAEIAEGIMLDHHQHVIEGTMSNIFGVLDDELYTPLLDRCGVMGITRQKIIQLAGAIGVTVNEIEISKQNFLNMDGAFVCNSLIHIWPVTKIIDEDTSYDLSSSELIYQLQVKLKESQ